MSELPPGWVEATIGDLAEYISRGKSPKYTDRSELPVVNQRAIRWSGIEDEHLKYIHPDQFEQWTEERFIRAGDILWNSTGTGTIGRACLAQPKHITPPRVVDSHVTIVRPVKAAIDPRYLFAWIRGPQVQRTIEDLATGTTNQIELSRSTVAGTELPLAPLNEQKRIADKLDAVFARVDACRERLDRVPAILKRFRQAVVAAATAGDLTADWRAIQLGSAVTSRMLRGWRKQPLADLCDRERVITYGVIKLGSEFHDGVPCLRTSNVRWLQIDTDGMKRISPVLSSEYARTVLRGGEVLVNVRGTLGGVAVATPDMAGWNVSREVAVVPVNTERVDSTYLTYWIGSDPSQRWLSRVEKGVAYIGINIEDLRNLPVEVPSIDEQQEIVRRVEALMAYADRLEARYTTAHTQVERLTPALLAKAFRGELVPQDPNDEPASVLLERIHAARAAASERSPRKVRTERRPMPTKLTTDTLKEIIRGLPTDWFTFDNLREQVSADYETLKDLVFELLSEAPASVKQVFDAEAQTMRLVRVKR